MPLTPAEAFATLTPDEQAALLERATQPPPPPAAVEDTPPPEADEPSPWAELDDFYDDELLLEHKTRGGVVHRYRLHAVDVRLGLLCQRLVNVGMGALTDYHLGERTLKLQEGTEETLDDSTEEELYRHLLGGVTDHPQYDVAHDVWKQLHDEGASWPLVRHLGTTAIMWAGRDRTTARDYWLGGGRPKAPAESTSNPTTPTQPRDRRPSSKAGGASSTRRRASTSSTKTAAAKPKGTGGAKS